MVKDPNLLDFLIGSGSSTLIIEFGIAIWWVRHLGWPPRAKRPGAQKPCADDKNVGSRPVRAQGYKKSRKT